MGSQVTYAASTGPDSVATGDLNNNCLDDVAVSHWNAGNIRTFIQQPNGTLQSTTYSSPQAGWDDIDTGDVNNDGLIDIVKMNGQGQTPLLSVFLQNPSGGFYPPVPYTLSASFRGGVAVGDVTGDGLDDVVVAYGGNRPSSKISVFAQTITGTLTLQATYNAFDIPEPVEIADVNLDGRLDVIVAHGGWVRVGVFLQQANGTLAPYVLYPVPYASHYGPQGLEVGDINNDGAPDVGLADYNNGLVILYNNLPSFTVASTPDRFVKLPGATFTGTLILNPGQGFNGAVTLTIEGLPPGSSYTFAPNPVTPAAQTVFTITTPVLTGSGAFPLTFRGTGNGVINTAPACLRIDASIISGLTATNDSPTVLGNTTTLTGSIVTGNDVSYTWAFGDGSTGSGPNIGHTYPAVGVYTAVLTASNSVGSQTVQTSVTIIDEAVDGLTAVNDSPTLINQITTLTATVAAGTNVLFSWDFGDGSTGSGPHANQIYPAVGTYTATVTATNSLSSQTAQTTVTIVDEAITGLTAVNDSPTTLGHHTTLTATISSGTNVSYTWDLGNGAMGNGPIVSHQYPAAGTYTAVITASNSTNSVTANTTVQILAPISGLIAWNDSPTPLGNATSLAATVATGTDVSYTWDLGDGSTGSGMSIVHNYPAIGTYTAVVTATNLVSALTTPTTVIITDEAIAGLAAVNDSPTVIGAVTALTATISSGGNVTYLWDLGDGTTGSGATLNHQFPAVGLYTAVVTATNSTNTLATTTLIEVIDEAIVGLTAVNDGPTLLGNTTVLSAAITSGSNAIYTWNLGDGTILTGAIVTYTYALTGTYTAVVTASNTAGHMNAATMVNVYTVEAPPIPHVIYLPLIKRMAETPPALPLHISPAIPARPVQQVGEIFFVTNVRLPDDLPTSGAYYFSAAPDQLQPIVIDDKLTIQSGNTTYFTYTFAEENAPNPIPALVEIPHSVIANIAGRSVTIVYQDTYGGLVHATEVWLIWLP
ncbi:MAG: PKD domain-containing protein [Anaerolineae bacterium]|nr:PKD domain-containing protein [Anaerolineae bacterium]